MTDFKFTGADQLAELAKQCKATGENEIRKDMLRGLRETGKPVVQEVRASPVRTLPRRGGLGHLISRAKVGVRSKTSVRSAGVSIEAKSAGHDLDAIDRGRLRRPTFGHRPWVTQHIRPGFWSDVVENTADDARKRMEQVLDDIARRLGGS